MVMEQFSLMVFFLGLRLMSIRALQGSKLRYFGSVIENLQAQSQNIILFLFCFLKPEETLKETTTLGTQSSIFNTKKKHN